MIKNVLIVNNDLGELQILDHFLGSQSGFLKIFTAVSHREGLQKMEKEEIDLVVVKIDRFEFGVARFISHCSKKRVGLKIIVLAGTQVPFFASIKKNPDVIVLELLADTNMLTSRVLTELAIEPGGFMQGVNLSSFLQMMELDNTSCLLKIEVKQAYGFLWIKNGMLVAAEQGNLKGKEAVLKMISWETATVYVNYAPFTRENEFAARLMPLILEGNRLTDDFEKRMIDKRESARYDLFLAIELFWGDRKYHCLLRDISMHGAYIEIEQKIERNEDIVLILASALLQVSCSVKGKIVYLAEKGAGVQFFLENSEQEQVIQMLIDSSRKVRGMKAVEALANKPCLGK